MGIEEAILQEVREQSEQIGLQQGELRAKIKGIKRLILQDKLTLLEIAEVFEVSLDFVQKVQKERT